MTGAQLPIEDQQVILRQQAARETNHPFSSTAKSRTKCNPPIIAVNIGDLVILKGERDKTQARDKYLVTRIENDHCFIRKFTQSQFRSKEYEVPMTQCHPLHPSVPVPPPGHIRDLDTDQDEDDDDDNKSLMEVAINTPPCVTPALDMADQTLPIPPAEIVDQLEVSQPNVQPTKKDLPMPDIRRSERKKNPPPSHTDDKWLFY